jgi:hypothetical protein
LQVNKKDRGFGIANFVVLLFLAWLVVILPFNVVRSIALKRLYNLLFKYVSSLCAEKIGHTPLVKLVKLVGIRTC